MDAVVMRQQNICPQELSHLDHFRVQQCRGDVSKIEVRTSYGGWLRIVATICYKALVPLYWSHTSIFRFMQPRQNRRITWIHLSVYRVFFVWASYKSCWIDNTIHKIFPKLFACNISQRLVIIDRQGSVTRWLLFLLRLQPEFDRLCTGAPRLCVNRSTKL